MKIGIIGSGNMGRALGILWAEQGHEVFFGARTTEKGQDVAAIAGHKTQGGSNDEAAAFGAVLLYTVRGVNPAEVFSSLSVLDGKVLIDCNNQERTSRIRQLRDRWLRNLLPKFPKPE